jgi:hypothetical protein
MQKTFGTPEYWRERAKEARTKAAGMRDRDAKKSMLDVCRELRAPRQAS